MRPPLVVIVDTNTIWNDRKNSSANWLQLREIHNYFTCEVVVPAVVVHELVGLRLQDTETKEKEIREAARKIEKHIKELNNHVESLGGEKLPFFDSAKFVEELGCSKCAVAGFEEQCASQLADLGRFFGVKVIKASWPSETHEEIVKRCSQRRAPFTFEQGKDKGYKDYLLWLSVVNKLREGHGDVVLVTNDKAFFDEDGSINSHLRDDLESEGIDVGRLLVCKGLPALNSSFVSKYTEPDTEFEKALRADNLQSVGTQIAAFSKEFKETLKHTIIRHVFMPAEFAAVTEFETTAYHPALIDLLEARKHPSNSHHVKSKVVCRYFLQIDRYARDGAALLSVNHWLGIQCDCQMFIDQNGKVLAAQLDASSAVLSDLADCRVTVKHVDSKDFVDVAASMRLAVTEESSREFKEQASLDLCLQDLGVNQPHCTLTVSEDGATIFTLPSVPTSLLKKWGFKAPVPRPLTWSDVL